MCRNRWNDIQRLQCFDAAYASTTSNDLSPLEAVKKLSDLVAYTSPDQYFELYGGENPCAIQAVFKRRCFKCGVIKSDVTSESAIFSYVNLSNVERIGGWQSPWAGAIQAIVLYTKRNTEGGWVHTSQSYDGEPRIPAEEINRLRMKQFDSYSGRDARFYLLVEEYFPDREKVIAALQDAVKACTPK